MNEYGRRQKSEENATPRNISGSERQIRSILAFDTIKYVGTAEKGSRARADIKGELDALLHPFFTSVSR